MQEITSFIPEAYEKDFNIEAEAFQTEFSFLLNKQYAQVNSIINETVPNYLYGIKLLKIKNEIYQFFQSKLLSLIKHYNGTDTIDSLLKIFTSINTIIEEKEALMTRFITMLSDKISNSTLNESNAKELGVLRSKLNEKAAHNNILEQENKSLKEKFEKLERENKTILYKCFDKAKMIQMNKSFNNSSSPKEETKFNFNASSSNGFMSTLNQQMIPRVVSKECLLEIIKEIYNSKMIANNKCRSNNEPIDTLEHHMYKYLNQKYGLKRITLEYVAGIIQAIKDYSIDNSEICLFGKILRNELEESSITLLSKIKESVSDALIYFLQQKNKAKNLEEIRLMANNVKNGLIEEELWNKIIDFLFISNKNDRESIKNKIHSFIKNIMNESIQKKATELNNRSISSYKQMKQERILIEEISNYQKKISYTDLLNIILAFHIRTRAKYLNNFQKAFALYDKDRNGIINEDDFCSLITLLDIYPKEIINAKLDLFLNELPLQNQYSFSEIVDLLENDRISKTLSAMDAIAMKSS